MEFNVYMWQIRTPYEANDVPSFSRKPFPCLAATSQVMTQPDKRGPEKESLRIKSIGISLRSGRSPDLGTIEQS